MRSKGWYEKCGVKILEGRWQDFISTGEIFGEGGWDVVYVDTFAEGYEGRRFYHTSRQRKQRPIAHYWIFWQNLNDSSTLFRISLVGQMRDFHFSTALARLVCIIIIGHGGVKRSRSSDAVFYDIYTQLAEMHLQDAGVTVKWTEVDTEDIKTPDRWGGTREYFRLRLYRLPIGRMVQV